MNLSTLSKYLCQLKDNFTCVIDENKSHLVSYIVRANIEDKDSAKKFIHLFTTVTNAPYDVSNYELINPTK